MSDDILTAIRDVEKRVKDLADELDIMKREIKESLDNLTMRVNQLD